MPSRGGSRADGPLFRAHDYPALDVQDYHVDVDADRIAGKFRISKGGLPGGWSIEGARVIGGQGRTPERVGRDAVIGAWIVLVFVLGFTFGCGVWLIAGVWL